MYSDDSMIKAQKRVIAMQKKQLQLQKSQTPKEYARDKKVDIGSIFSDLDILENDINLTKRDLDEYMTFRGNSSRNIPSMHSISPLSRKILSALKKVDFKEVPENQLRDLNTSGKKVLDAWDNLIVSVNDLNHIANGPRPKDEPFRRLFAIAKKDLKITIEYIGTNLGNVAGHNYLVGGGIPKRFL